MRTEKEMLDVIVGVAEQDGRIRAVYMNGSRTNPHARKDRFQDYDVVYVVTETASFINDSSWIERFGSLLMLQEPDKNDQSCGIHIDFTQSYTYLMLFTDGNRLDLCIETKEAMQHNYVREPLTLPLLDKDSCLPVLPSPTDSDYYVKVPTEQHYVAICNEFWWCMQNVGKGIWRDELPYAMNMLAQVIRPCLDQMIAWWVACTNNYDVTLGKMNKYMKRHLPKTYWEMYEKTYPDSNVDNMWKAVFVMGDLFRFVAMGVAEHLHYTYNAKDDRNMMDYLRHVRELPMDNGVV